MNRHTYYNDMVGRLRITEDEGAIVRVEFADRDERVQGSDENCDKAASELMDRAYRQIEEYLRGERIEFQLPVKMNGSKFQEDVWCALLDIPYGETRSYGELAEIIGRPNAARAVGTAMNRNSLPIIFPCHRVVTSDGRLGGYLGGVDLKQKLLDLERSVLARETLQKVLDEVTEGCHIAED